MGSREYTIHIRTEAPVKPDQAAPCNGCGICCLAQPCPVGMLLSRRRTGACVAVVWRDDLSRYICGAVRNPFSVVVKRWIGAGAGCDCSLEDPRRNNGNEMP